jgi:hypothetical protein
MPCDPHVAHFDGGRGGEHGDAVPVDVREGQVLDGLTLEQDAYGRVTAEDEGLVESEESGWCTLF